MSSPKWITPERQQRLVTLFNQSQGFCIYGHKPCKGHWQPNIKAVSLGGNRVELVTTYNWRCDYADHPCYNPYDSFYVNTESRLITDWVNDDRRQLIAERQAEIKREHATNFRTYPLHGTFSGVSRDIYHDQQPCYYINGYGVSGVTCKPFVRLRIASSGVHLYVDISQALLPLSALQRRKARRYKHSGVTFNDRVDYLCQQAYFNFSNIT